MAEPQSPLAPGTSVGDTYDVERLLGRGGMGEVWLASHRRIAGKQVAIKVLRTSSTAVSDETLKRFRREAEIAARLEHPNIVHVSDFNQLPSGEPYLVMEYLKGESLAARMRGGALPLEEVLAIIRQVGAALQTAHAGGVVHRDLKPDNIYLVPTAMGDRVKVLDFGISKLSDSETLQTTDRTLLGTPLYMSPEQALGQNKEVTAQSDLFALGSICYELLTGKAPFVAESIANVVFRIAYQPHEPLANVAPHLPPNITAAIEHALLKDKAQRTRDIATFVQELTGSVMTPQGPSSPRETVSGVYSPGMRISDSLASNPTMTPGPGMLPKAPTPNAGARPPAKKNTVSVLVGVLSVILVALGLKWVGTPPPRGPVAVLVPDAAVPALVVTPPPPALVVGVPDAAVEVAAPEPVDAGPAHVVEPKRPKTPGAELTAADQSLVLEVRTLAASQRWDELASSSARLLNATPNTTALREVVLSLIEAECARGQLAKANSFFRRLEPAARGRAREVCRRHQPEWELTQ